MTSPIPSRTRPAKSRALALLITALLFINASIIVASTHDPKLTSHEGLPNFISYYAPNTLTYDEVLELAGPSGPPAALRPKLDALLNAAFISNEVYLSAGMPMLSQSDRLGKFIRVGSWNIQRGLRLNDIEVALTDPEEFRRRIKFHPGSPEYREAVEGAEILRSVDILVVNEADLGLTRTEYTDVAKRLAVALKMNYAYGVEFIEIDPLTLGTEKLRPDSPDKKKEQPQQAAEVDKQRFRGLHGTAILSRFPIKQARLIPLKYQPYDWHMKERDKVSLAESARRRLGKMAFMEDVPREIRYGGRMVLIVEFYVPQLADGALTVVATHLEDRCKPSERRRQMQEVLSLIKDIKGPVVLAGDMNTTGYNMKPISIAAEIKRRIGSKKFWAKQMVKAATSLGMAFDFLLEVVASAQTLYDPTAKGIFLFAPNKEADIFKDLERMRFSDGYAFDFRGDSERTVNGTKGTLANSNQRARNKGFISTHATARTILGIGKHKLDWIFVKPYVKDPKGKSEPYKLAPHFARTLEKFNYCLGERLSDHNPITVDLPIEEPDLAKK